MEKVILRRRGVVFRWDRPLQLAGECLGLAGMTALVPVVIGWPPPVILWFWPAAVAVAAVVPVKALVADRHGVSLGSGRERRTIGWDQVTRVVVEGRGRTTVVGVRTPPEAPAPASARGRSLDLLDRLPVAVGRPRARGDRPFAVAAEASVAGVTAAEAAERIGTVTTASVACGEASYRVRAPLRSVLPLAVFAVLWVGGIGSALVATTVHDYPRAAIPFAVVGAGAVLTLADLLTPGWILSASGAGLLVDGEFLAGEEIEAIELAAVSEGTEVRIRLTPGTPAAEVAPEINRTLRRVRLDPARLAAALPPNVRTDATA